MSIPLSTINTGSTANDGTGDTVRAAFTTVNTNFQSVNTVVSALQSNAVTAATIVSLNMTGNLVANIITANTGIYANAISTAAGTNANLIIDPDGTGDVVFPVQTEIYVNSTAANAITIAGGIQVANTVSANAITLTSALQFANLTTAQISVISPTRPGMTVYNYTTGNIQVYNGTKWANITLS